MSKKFGNFKIVLEKLGNLEKNKIGNLGKGNWKFEKINPLKFGKMCKFGQKLELWEIILKVEKNMKNFEKN